MKLLVIASINLFVGVVVFFVGLSLLDSRPLVGAIDLGLAACNLLWFAVLALDYLNRGE